MAKEISREKAHIGKMAARSARAKPEGYGGPL